MGQCYSVEASFRFKNGDSSEFCRIIRNYIEKHNGVDASFGHLEGLNLSDPFDCFCAMTGGAKQSGKLTDPPAWTSDFDASYGWESVMEEIFGEVLQICDDGSYVYIDSDDYWICLTLIDGKVVFEDGYAVTVEERIYMDYAGCDAVFLPRKDDGSIDDFSDSATIIYYNEQANYGRGSFEIEYVDKERILKLNEEVQGNAEEFFESLPDWFQGEWYYCDNVPEKRKEYYDLLEQFFDADFLVGRDGGIEEELEFLINWAREVRA